MANIICLIGKHLPYSPLNLPSPACKSQSWICRIETGNRNPTLGCISRIARALRVNPSDLLRDAAERGA